MSEAHIRWVRNDLPLTKVNPGTTGYSACARCGCIVNEHPHLLDDDRCEHAPCALITESPEQNLGIALRSSIHFPRNTSAVRSRTRRAVLSMQIALTTSVEQQCSRLASAPFTVLAVERVALKLFSSIEIVAGFSCPGVPHRNNVGGLGNTMFLRHTHYESVLDFQR